MSGQKIKVLIGANDLLLAGVQRLVVDYLRHADRQNQELHLIVLMQFPGKETFYTDIPNDVHLHKLSFSGLADIKSWIRLYKLLGSIKPDIVKTATFFSNTIFLVLRPFFNYRIIVAEHNTVRQKPLWQRFVDRILFTQACKVVGDSAQVVEFVSSTEGIPKGKFIVIHNGVDLEAVAEARKYKTQRTLLLGEHKIPETAYIFFTAARLVHQKNHKLMLDAFALVSAQYADAYLVIAGDGGLQSALESQARSLEISRRVIFLGAQQNVQRYYAISDTFVLTSRHEGFCIAVMEALAFGLPVVSTRVAGVEDYLIEGRNGFFAEPTPISVAKNMLRTITLSATERERMGAEGRQTANKYSTKQYAQALDDCIANCLKEHR